MAGRPAVSLVVRCDCFGVKPQDVRMTVIGRMLPSNERQQWGGADSQHGNLSPRAAGIVAYLTTNHSRMECLGR